MSDDRTIDNTEFIQMTAIFFSYLGITELQIVAKYISPLTEVLTDSKNSVK